jgi:DNA repair protein SbcD/Mre11
MKFIHFADIHIGVETYGSTDPETGLSTRVIDELNAIDELIDYAIENRVDLVLFCGDAYKSREPSPTHQREFAKRIRRLSESKIQTVLVVGNHDLPGSPGKANSVEIFDTLDIFNVCVVNKPGILKVITHDGELQIAVFPWLRKNALLTKEDIRNLSVEEVFGKMQEVMAAKIMELAGEINPAHPAILAGHLSISNAKLGTERNMVLGNEPSVMLSTIANPVYDYVALGHVHVGQVLSENPPVVYSGSLERLDFGDENIEKGFYVVEINKTESGKTCKYNFHNIKARRFLTMEVAVHEDTLDPTTLILGKIKEFGDQINGAIVKLKLGLPANLTNSLREPEIFRALKDAYNVSIVKEIRRLTRSRMQGSISSSVNPLEALKKYMENINLPAERSKKLLEYGERLITDEALQDRGTYAK